MAAVWGIVVVLSLLVVFPTLLRVLIVRFFGLRLTDWLGYIACAAGLVVVPMRLWDTNPWWLLGVPVAAVVAVVAARRTLIAWRRGDVVHGIFAIGRAPDGVVDRF